MIKSPFLFTVAMLLAVVPATATEPQKLTIAQAQFPAPHSQSTDMEWSGYRMGFYVRHGALPAPMFRAPDGKTRSLTPTEIRLFSDYDADGRPMWWDGMLEEDLGNMISGLLEEDKFEEIDRLLAEWTAHSERVADGRWMLRQYLEALEARFTYKNGWDRELQRIARWKPSSRNRWA